TCSSFQSLLSLKDFWLKALDRAQTAHMQPLPCPPGANVFDMPIDTLQKLAIHAYSLRKNWSSERAIPVSVRTISLGDEYQQICVIPGTDMVVTNSYEQLACWQTQSGACLGVIAHEDDFATHDVGQSSLFHLPGQSFIALSSLSSETFGLIVIKIDYRNRDAIAVSRTYSHVLSTADIRPSAIDTALDARTVGMVFTSLNEHMTMLVYCNFEDNVVRHVPLGIYMGKQPTCALHTGHFYIYAHDHHGSDVPTTVLRVRLQIDTSRTTFAHDIDRVQVPDSIPPMHDMHDRTYIALGNPRMLPPTYGVGLVTAGIIATLPSFPGPPQRIRSVRFWPASATPYLEFGELASYEHNFEITKLAVGTSGRYAAIVDMEPWRDAWEPKNNLGLVHYGTHPSLHPTFHLLDTAGFELNYYTVVLALDDALGVVYITNTGQREAATMLVLSYA
ncbi:hypothetical protein B0H13DRAFT_2053287, partial [Mycena leptocephala]